MNSCHIITLLSATALISSAWSQCPTKDAASPEYPLTYPMTSDRYAVQYQLGHGAWTDFRVYICSYGETLGSPYRTNSGYSLGSTSMSFVSIPPSPNTIIRMRVTKLFGNPFQFSYLVSARPSVNR